MEKQIYMATIDSDCLDLIRILFRVKQIDWDGSMTLSTIPEIRFYATHDQAHDLKGLSYIKNIGLCNQFDYYGSVDVGY